MKTPQLLAPHFEPNLQPRHRVGKIWRFIFQLATVLGIVMLTLLMLTIINNLTGYVVISSKVDPDSLAINGLQLEEMQKAQLIQVLEENLSKGMVI